MDTLPIACPDTTQHGVRTPLDYGHTREAASGAVRAKDRDRGHTPTQSVRMPDERWGQLGDAYGARNRSAVINQVVAYLLREPGAKLPPRAPLPKDGTGEG